MIKAPKWDDKIPLLFLCLALLSEFFLLDQNFTLKERIDSYHHLEELLAQAQARYERSVLIDGLEGRCLPLSSRTNFVKELGTIPGITRGKFILILYFTVWDRTDFLRDEIVTWNDFYQSHAEWCAVIGITDTVGISGLHRITGSMQIKFPIIGVADLQARLVDYGITSTPVVFFGESRNRKVIYSHFPGTADMSRDGFARKLHRFLDLCTH